MKLPYIYLTFALILGLPAGLTAQEEAAPEPLPANLVAKVDGIEISKTAYQNFLYQRLGKRPLQQMIDQQLAAAASERYGISIPSEASETLLATRLEDARQGRSEEQFSVSLGDSGLNLDLFRGNLRLDVLQELRLDALVMATRVVSDTRLQKAFDAKYGAGGIKVEVRHILVMPHFLRANLIKSGVKAKDIDNQQMKVDAERVAGECWDRLNAGENFINMVAEYSHDQVSLRTEGLLPSYRPGLYGKEFTAAVSSLAPGKYSNVIESGAGFHVVLLESRLVTELDSVRVSLSEEVMASVPTWQEREELLGALRSAADIQLW